MVGVSLKPSLLSNSFYSHLDTCAHKLMNHDEIVRQRNTTVPFYFSVKCDQKTVKRAYYTVCQPCCESLKICGKCGKAKEIVEG